MTPYYCCETDILRIKMDTKDYEEALSSLVKIVEHISRGDVPERAIINVLGLNETLLYFDERIFWKRFLERYRENLILQTIALLIKNYSLDPTRLKSLIERLLTLTELEKIIVKKQQKIANRVKRHTGLLSAVSAYSIGVLVGLMNFSNLLKDFFNIEITLLSVGFVAIQIISLLLAEAKILMYVSSNCLLALENMRKFLSRILLISLLSLFTGFLISLLFLI